MRHSMVVFRTSRGLVALPVEVKATEAERALGYSYRTSVNPHSGMVFVFATEAPRVFQMAQTYVALDMIFVDARGIVTKVVHGAAPRSSALYEGVAQRVVEVPSPWAREHGVRVGDRVTA